MDKRTQDALIGGLVGFVLYFATLPVITSSSGWNDSATYATVYKSLVPVGIAIATGLAVFMGIRRA